MALFSFAYLPSHDTADGGPEGDKLRRNVSHGLNTVVISIRPSYERDDKWWIIGEYITEVIKAKCARIFSRFLCAEILFHGRLEPRFVDGQVRFTITISSNVQRLCLFLASRAVACKAPAFRQLCSAMLSGVNCIVLGVFLSIDI